MAGFRRPGPTGFGLEAPIDRGTSCLAATPAPGPVGPSPQPSPGSSALAWLDDGLEIVVTPIQLAAILGDESIEPASWGDRVWGGITVIGGALELVGATALLLTPEPTNLTKLAGGALGAHGVDTATAGVKQVITGQPVSTLTAASAKSAAAALGVDERHAALIGLTVDIALPLMLGLAGAARILAIRRGAISLASEELAGGHTLARHVGQSEAQLRARLAAETRIKAASTFHTLADAEKFVAEALRANQSAIKSWAKTAAVGQTKAVVHDAGRSVGFGVVRATQGVTAMTRLTVVIRKIQTGDRIYFVLTAYPKP